MNAKPVLAPVPLGTTLAAAALSILVTIGLLLAVAGLFLREGTPLQNVVAAENACRDLAFQSERDACVRSYVAPEQRVVSSTPREPLSPCQAAARIPI